jgi:phosphoserine phosphatase
VTTTPWPDGLTAELDAMIARHGVYGAEHDPVRPPLAALDWDDTCMVGDISHEALDLLEAAEPTGRVERYHAACAADLYAAYRELVHTLMAGRTPEQARQLAEDAFAAGSSAGRLRLREEMGRLVQSLQANGWIVRVVTASPAPLVQPLARRFGVPPDHVLGVASRVSPQGRFLAELVEPVTIGPGKLAAIQAHAGRDPMFAAGDSASDQPMMLASRYGLFFDRGDPALRSVAAERGWWIVPASEAS